MHRAPAVVRRLPNGVLSMSDNTAPRDDDTSGAKYARWIAWILIAAAGVFFVVYTAFFQ
jgi:hypothetical protein